MTEKYNLKNIQEVLESEKITYQVRPNNGDFRISIVADIYDSNILKLLAENGFWFSDGSLIGYFKK